MPKRRGWTIAGAGAGGRKSRGGRGMGRMLVDATAREMLKEEMAEERHKKLLKTAATARNKENGAAPVVKTGKTTAAPLQAANSNSDSNARPITAETKKAAATPLLLDHTKSESNDKFAQVAFAETKKADEVGLSPVLDASNSNAAFPSVAQRENPKSGTVVEQGTLKEPHVGFMVSLGKIDDESIPHVSEDKEEKGSFEKPSTRTLKQNADVETNAIELATAFANGPITKKYRREQPTLEQVSQNRKEQLLSFTRWWRRRSSEMPLDKSSMPLPLNLDSTIARSPVALVFNEAGPNYVVGATWCRDDTLETSELPYAWMEIDYSNGTVVRQGGSNLLFEDQGGWLLKFKLLSTMDCNNIPAFTSLADWKNSIAMKINDEVGPHAPVFLNHVPAWMYAHGGL